MPAWLAWILDLFAVAEFTAPSVTASFRRKGDPSMPLAGTTTISLSPPDPRVSIASRPITVAIGTAAPVALDGINGPVTVACNEDDVLAITAQDVSKGGVKSPVATLTYTAVDTVTVPVAPTISASFAVAAPAPPPPPPATA